MASFCCLLRKDIGVAIFYGRLNNSIPCTCVMSTKHTEQVLTSIIWKKQHDDLSHSFLQQPKMAGKSFLMKASFRKYLKEKCLSKLNNNSFKYLANFSTIFDKFYQEYSRHHLQRKLQEKVEDSCHMLTHAAIYISQR